MNLRTLGLTKILLTFIILSIIGALMIYSASSYDLLMQGVKPTAVFIKQGIIMCLSWVLMFMIYKVRLEVLFNKKIAIGLLLVSVLLLLMVRLPFFGVAANGAQRWISLFGIQFQPSELCNFAIIYYLSCYLGEKENGLTTKQLRKQWLFVLVVAFLVLIQPKVGGAILILVIGSVLIFSASIHAKFSVIAAGIVVAIAALLSKIIIFLGDHQYLPHFFAHVYDRLVVLKNPFLSFHDRGFQPSMAYLAMYNGGFWGTGLANGMVKKGGLPEGQTDFIFAVIVEELGLIGGLLLLFLLLFLAASILRSSCVIKNHCYGLFLLGVGTLILAQTAINIGGVLGLIPMTGIPLPFVSYGGTSYLIFSVALGIVIKIIANERRQLNGQYKKIQLTS